MKLWSSQTSDSLHCALKRTVVSCLPAVSSYKTVFYPSKGTMFFLLLIVFLVFFCTLFSFQECWSQNRVGFFFNVALSKKDFIYSFLERGEEKERNINACLLLQHPVLGNRPATQACALTENQTGDPLVHGPHSIH